MTVVCPYCFSRLRRSKLLFRCLLATRGIRSRPCQAQLDQRLADFVGNPGPAMLGPVFAPRGRDSRQPCPNCGGMTPKRVCPECHNDLPGDYGTLDSRIVALVGSRTAGKSTYITILVEELRKRVGDSFSLSLNAMDDRTVARHAAEEERLYDRGQLPVATRPSSVDINYPLLYRLTGDRGRLRPLSTCSTSLVFFDTAGEDLLTADAIARHVPYLAEAHGIILLIDPLQFRGVRDTLDGTGVDLPPRGTPPDELVATIATLIRGRHGWNANRKVRTPVAAALSKIDALWPCLDGGTRLHSPSRHDGVFDELDRTELHDEITARLQEWDGGVLRRTLEAHFTDFSFFALSALGGLPVARSGVPAHGVLPYRVEDPVLWLLARESLVDVRRVRG